ncbi:MAG: hypothetical protein R2695_04225 [Acidimicrobiales bacterium]
MRCMAVMVVAAAVFGGCSDDGGAGGGGAAADPGEAGVVAAATELAEGAFSGDWSKVRAGRTPECQETTGVGDLAVEGEFGMSMAAGFSGIEREDLRRAEVRDVVVLDIVEGESATASIETWLDGELLFAVDETGEDYLYVGGRWRSASCDFGVDADG